MAAVLVVLVAPGRTAHTNWFVSESGAGDHAQAAEVVGQGTGREERVVVREVLVALLQEDVIAVHRHQAAGGQRLRERPAGVEAEVGVVEQAGAGVVPAARQQLGGDVAVSDVGHAQHADRNVALEQGAHHVEQPLAVDEVLEAVEGRHGRHGAIADDAVEGLGGVRGAQVDQVRLHPALAGHPDGLAVRVDAHVGQTERLDRLGKGGGPAREVEVDGTALDSGVGADQACAAVVGRPVVGRLVVAVAGHNAYRWTA